MADAVTLRGPVVDASVAGSGKRVRVTAQSTDAATDVHLWARSDDRTVRDALAVQTDVADALARDIQGHLGAQ